MKSPLLPLGRWLFLALAGGAAGHWLWPRVEVNEPAEILPVRSATAPPRSHLPSIPPSERPEDTARAQTRQLALRPPPALTHFLEQSGAPTSVQQALFADAASWAYCRNPAAGLAQLGTVEGYEEIQKLAKKMLRNFPPKDLPIVAAWAQELPEGALKCAALKEILPIMKRQDYAAALAFVMALPEWGGPPDPSTARMIVRKSFLSELLLGSPPNVHEAEQRLALFPASEQPRLKQEIAREKFSQLVKFDQEHAVLALADVPQEERANQAGNLFRDWVERDPIRAAPALQQLPADVPPQKIYREFAETWARGNVSMASAWVHDLPAGPAKEAAVTGLVSGLQYNYPAEALTWAITITDSAAQALAMQAVLRNAAPEKLPALQQAIDSLPLTPEQMTALTPPPSP